MKKFDYDVPVANLETFEEINDLINKAMLIDEDNLDMAGIEQSKIFALLQRLYIVNARRLEIAMEQLAKAELIRHKYYSGKLPSDYYQKEPLREVPLKGDIDKILKTDDVVLEAKRIVNEQDRIVKLIEQAQKEQYSRGHNIRNCIEYRKFISGSN